jgi:hypothetical protein
MKTIGQRYFEPGIPRLNMRPSLVSGSMQFMKNFLFAAVLIFLPLAVPAQTVPALINYQGRLANPDGSVLVTANYQLSFSVFDSASGGNLVWGPEVFDGSAGQGHGALIPVVQGYFNVLLGPVDVNGASLAGAFNGTNRFVEVTVTNHAPIAPRQQILSAPFAIQAAFAGSAAVASNVVSGVIVSNLNLSGPEATIFSGTTTVFYSDGVSNFFAGSAAGNSLTTGSNNTGTGYEALFRNTGGSSNTATGFEALYNNRNGLNNVADGSAALFHNQGGNANTATGAGALFNNNTGGFNTANGYEAMYNNNGNYNTANGYEALFNNNYASYNTASGYEALFANNSGQYNTADGYQALYSNTVGQDNTADGFEALYSGQDSQDCTAIGTAALYSCTSGHELTAVGTRALYGNTTGSQNTAVGSDALSGNSSGTGNTALGYAAGSNITNNYNIDIGSTGVSGDSGTIRIGSGVQNSTYIAGIFGSVASSGIAVYVNSSGQLGTATSSARFKTNIASMDDASDVLLSLHPVKFRYRPEIDPQGIPQFGLVAEEVDKIDPDLVVRDDKNQIYTVRYEAVNAMLLNEFLKEHRTVQEQMEKIRHLEERLDAVEKATAAHNPH